MIIHDEHAGDQGLVWEVYDGYEKRFCDIRLNNGEEWGCCWPNAGKFVVLHLPEKWISEDDVTHIRYYESGE